MEFAIELMNSSNEKLSNAIYGNIKIKYKYIDIDGFIFSYIYVKNNKDFPLLKLNQNQINFLQLKLDQKKIYVTETNFFRNTFDICDEINISCLDINGKPINKINDLDIENIKQTFFTIPISSNMTFSFINKFNKLFTCTIVSQNIHNKLLNCTSSVFVGDKDGNILSSTAENTELFKGKFNFNEMDIGGLDNEFLTLFRRAFASRLIPLQVRKDLGIKDVKGIMLHGPPGTGKTLIARKLSKIINCENRLKIVTGPSLLGGIVGSSEANVRKLFKDAEDAYKTNPDSTDIYVIVCDECDAIFRTRGFGNGSAGDRVNDNMVNQFLSKIDGPEMLPNIFLICMTNNLHMIDPAIIRPGRIELLLEIKLPDEKGRRDILNIHLRKINNKHISTLNINSLIELSENYTGAEIEGAVENAKSFAISRLIDPNDLNEKKDYKNLIITQKDLESGLKEIIPAFGKKSKFIDIMTAKPFVSNELYNRMCNLEYKNGNINSILIVGEKKSGKTTMACHLAKHIEKCCIKFINSEELYGDYNNFQRIILDCYKSPKTTIIIDSVENIIQYSKLNSVYNNHILQIIYSLLNKIIDNDKRINVILTSRNKDLMNNLELTDSVNHVFEI